MNRILRNVIALVLGVVVGGYAVIAMAVDPVVEWKNPKTSVWEASVEAAKAGWEALYPYVDGSVTYYIDSSSVDAQGKITYYFHSCSPGCSPVQGPQYFQLISRQSCPSGYNLVGGQCVGADCPAVGTPQSSGWFLMGNSPSSPFPGVTCAGSCLVAFNGYAPAGQAIVGGQTQYFARGTWQYLGPSNTCSGGTATPAAQSALPPDTCAPNQYYGTINGKPVCVNATTGQPVNTSPASPSTTTSQTVNTTNPDGSTTKTTTTTNSDGSTTTTTTTTWPSGDSTTTTTTTPPPGEDQTDDFCKKSPDSPMCQEIEAGSPAGTSDLYTPESRTVGDVLSDFRAKVQSAPFYSGASNFFNIGVPSGACGGMNAQIAVGWGQSFNIDIDSVLCSSTAQFVYSVLGIGVMLVAAWVAFRIAIL